MQSPQCSEQLHQFTKLTTALNSAFLHIAHIAHVGQKNLVIRGLKEVRKCALNREWRSSDVFKVKRREGDSFCEVLWREETRLQYLCVLSDELLFA